MAQTQDDLNDVVKTAKASLNLQAYDIKRAFDSIQSKLKTLASVAENADQDGKYEVLFTAWDRDEDGAIDSAELTLGIKNVSPKSTFLAAATDEAVAGLLRVNADSDKTMDREQFKLFVNQLAAGMGSSFGDVAELLILGAIESRPAVGSDAALMKIIRNAQSKAEQQVQAAQSFAALAHDPAMQRLFDAFDRDGDGEINFKELVHVIQKLNPGETLLNARAAAVNAMLLSDLSSSRSLDRMEFARFIQRLGLLVGTDFHDMAEQLLAMAVFPDAFDGDDLATAASLNSGDLVMQVYETLADRKLHMLFELWDKDGDGCISFAELAQGLRKFSLPSEATMLLFDRDADQKLDRTEFATFILRFAEALQTDFDTIAEFLILLAALEDNQAEELALLLAEDTVNKAINELAQRWRAAEGVSESEEVGPQSMASIPEREGDASAPRPLTSEQREQKYAPAAPAGDKIVHEEDASPPAGDETAAEEDAAPPAGGGASPPAAKMEAVPPVKALDVGVASAG